VLLFCGVYRGVVVSVGKKGKKERVRTIVPEACEEYCRAGQWEEQAS
jgi:hypothetical protein